MDRIMNNRAKWMLFSFISMFALTNIANAQKTKSQSINQEYKKLTVFFGHERVELRKEKCQECTYLMLIKLFFDKSGNLQRALLSSSAPESLQGIPEKLIKLNINWRTFLNKSKNASIAIMPVSFICEKKDDRVLLSSKSLLTGLYSFPDGSVFNIWNHSTYSIIEGINIYTLSKEIVTEDPILDANKIHHQDSKL
ncbi:hypothetical protein [Chitinophaga nivalis]|uniref:TonB C-terminal domain-containing protein n=1 Tax=Chitinophaga nivalis TaxID=2991709 RepID=A0ABT3IM33_9BACT|nr:hypothetical protein [Chitinophaga nivalis]MCW3465282.1 hypothetical protein [Chitinophaga nivalis]MCW3485026.1 hypothetical protein [Chitinophaga nivalis]